MPRVYAYHNNAEQLIAIGRIIVTIFVIFSIWHDLGAYHTDAAIVIYFLTGYLGYAIVLLLAMRRLKMTFTNQPMVIYTPDLIFFGFFVLFTGGPTGTFYLYATFLMISASLRWQLRGTMLSVIIILVILVACTVYPMNLLYDPAYNKTHFVIREASLAIIGAMIGIVSYYEQKRRCTLAELAAWPRSMSEDVSAMMKEILKQTAVILKVPSILAIWDEDEEPWLHVASWSKNEFRYTRESSDVFGEPVAEPLTGKNFFCSNLLAPKTIIPESSTSLPTHFLHWDGAPLSPQLREKFPLPAVLSLVLYGKSVEGRLFAFGRQRMPDDGFILGQVVAREISNSLDQFYLLQQLKLMAVVEERSRLARDLHDGLLQNLAGVNLQLERVSNLLTGEAQKEQQYLDQSRDLIAATMQAIRSHIHQLRPIHFSLPDSGKDIADLLKEMAERIKHQWGLHVELSVKVQASKLPEVLVHGLYNIVHEAIVNAARHAKASSITAEITTTDDQVFITVTDNGCGFPFRGRYDLEALKMMHQGPVTLMERVAFMGGGLIIESVPTGTRLEFILPIITRLLH